MWHNAAVTKDFGGEGSRLPLCGRALIKWLKVKVHQEDQFVIAGFTQPPVPASILGYFFWVLTRKDAFATSVRLELG